MSKYSTLLSSLQEEAHEPADSTVFARHVRSALYYLRPLVVPWSHTSYTFSLAADQPSYERGADLPGDILSFDTVFLLYPGSSGGLNVELQRITIQEYRRLDVSTTAAVGIPNFYAWYDNKIWIWPMPGDATQNIRIDYQRDATRDENTGLEFDASNPDDEFTNEYFKRGEEMLRTRTLMTYAMTRSQSQAEAATAKLLFEEAKRSVMRERDMMNLEGNLTERYF